MSIGSHSRNPCFGFVFVGLVALLIPTIAAVTPLRTRHRPSELPWGAREVLSAGSARTWTPRLVIFGCSKSTREWRAEHVPLLSQKMLEKTVVLRSARRKEPSLC